MTTQKDLFEKRQLMGATLQLAANILQNPVENYTWEEVEAMKKDIEAARKTVNDYITQINQCIQDNCSDWREQWDLGFKLYDEIPNEYNPNDYDKETLKQDFEAQGVNPKLAEILAHSIVYPEHN